MHLLTSETCRELVERFGQVGDGVLEEVHYEPFQERARIVLRIQDPSNDWAWVSLKFHFQEVAEFHYDTLVWGQGDTTITHSFAAKSFEYEGESLLFLDFQPNRFEPHDSIERLNELTLEDFLKSTCFIAARSVEWETHPWSDELAMPTSAR